MQAKNYRLDELLTISGGKQFIIPVYQRNYTWNANDQVARLLDDFEKTLNEGHTHFIGSIIVLIKENMDHIIEYSLVDGQQRLTTIFLMIHALLRIVQEEGNEQFVYFLRNNYLNNGMISNPKYIYRLKPQVASNDDSYKLICEGRFDELDHVKTDSKIKENFEYIYDRLREIYKVQNEPITIINGLRNLYTVFIELDNSDNPQEIFESINSTGLKLTASDLIRNYILMNKFNSEQERLYNDYWKEFEKNTKNSKKLDSFFRFYLSSKLYSLTKNDQIYETFKTWWSDAIKKETENIVLDKLKTSVRNYNMLYISDDYDMSFGEPLKTFKVFKYETCAPFVLGLFEMYDEGLITKSEVSETLSIINIYFIRRILAGKENNDISRAFPTILKNVIEDYQNAEDNNFVEIVKSELIFKNLNTNAHMPTDEEIKDFLSSTNFYVINKAKYFLVQIENVGSRLKLDVPGCNIEHVMPQNRSDNYWRNLTKKLSDEQYASLVNSLGNLTLVAEGDNSEMKNYSFEKKKVVLNRSRHMKMNEDIINKSQWTEKDILERTNLLIGKLLKLYPYQKAKPLISDESKKIFIYDTNGDIFAIGYRYNDSSVAVLSGSVVDMSTESNQFINEARQQCLDSGDIVQSKGRYILKSSQILNSASQAAMFVLGGTRRKSSNWKDKDGNTVQF